MKILTDKVYYNGKEFIVNNWPEEPTQLIPTHYLTYRDFNEAMLANKKAYDAALTRAIEEGYVVSVTSEFTDMVQRLPVKESGFYTLPEPREFECTEDSTGMVKVNEYTAGSIKQRIAILLPKPSEEQVERQSFSEPSEKKTSNEWHKLHPSPVIMDPDGWDRKNYQFSWYEEKITLGEFEKRRAMSTVAYRVAEPSDKDQSSPAHTDNQEELWSEVATRFAQCGYAPSVKELLQDEFTITRKQK